MFMIERVIGDEVIQRAFTNTKTDAERIKKMIHGNRIKEIKSKYVIPQFWSPALKLKRVM